MFDNFIAPVYSREYGEYVLEEPWRIQIKALKDATPGELIDRYETVIGKIEAGGWLTLFGYRVFRWNGADVIPNRRADIIGSAVHDALRRCFHAAIERGEVPLVTWDQCDQAFYQTLRMAGDWVLPALIKYRAVNGILGRIYAWFGQLFRKPVAQVAKNHSGPGATGGVLTHQGSTHYCWAHAAWNAFEECQIKLFDDPLKIVRWLREETKFELEPGGGFKGAYLFLAIKMMGVRRELSLPWDAEAVVAHLKKKNHAAIGMETGNEHSVALLDVRRRGWLFRRWEFLREDSYGEPPAWVPEWSLKRVDTYAILIFPEEEFERQEAG